MSRWLRLSVPVAAAAFVLLLTAILRPITDRAFLPAMLPAVIAATWAAGWRGGAAALTLGFAGSVALVAPMPWTRPLWTTLWLTTHLAAIALTHYARKARDEAADARRVQRDQANRAADAVSARRAAFLAHASTVLASSPDYETTLAAVANLAVPQIADLCIVDIVSADGTFTPLAIAHADPSKVALVRELRRMYPLEPAAPHGPPRVLKSGRSIVYTELPESALTDAAVHPSDTRVALALGIQSTMAVPLLVGGRRLGVISFATTDSGRRFVAADLLFAEDLARRAAIAIDTATP